MLKGMVAGGLLLNMLLPWGSSALSQSSVDPTVYYLTDEMSGSNAPESIERVTRIISASQTRQVIIMTSAGPCANTHIIDPLGLKYGIRTTIVTTGARPLSIHELVMPIFHIHSLNPRENPPPNLRRLTNAERRSYSKCQW